MQASDLLHHVRYNRWATARTLESVRPLEAELLSRDLGASYGGVRGTLTHIYQADKIWLARLFGKPTGNLAEFQPPAEWDALEQEWLEILDHYIAWAQALPEGGWDRVVNYRDTKGTPYQSPVWQILAHLTNHDSYHRGQVAAMLRQLGQVPAGSDLILYYRSLPGG